MTDDPVPCSSAPPLSWQGAAEPEGRAEGEGPVSFLLDAGEESLRRVYTVAYRVARGQFQAPVADAEEVAQDMMLRAYQRLREGLVTVGWVVRGTRFLCIDRIRARACEARALELYAHSPRPAPPAQRFELTTALSTLPCQCQELIRMYFWEGRTWAEIDSRLAAGRRCAQYRTKKCVEALARRFFPESDAASGDGTA